GVEIDPRERQRPAPRLDQAAACATGNAAIGNDPAKAATAGHERIGSQKHGATTGKVGNYRAAVSVRNVKRTVNGQRRKRNATGPGEKQLSARTYDRWTGVGVDCAQGRRAAGGDRDTARP